MTEAVPLLAAASGAILGAVSDRLAARWPAHLDGRERPLDWRSVVVLLSGLAAFVGLVYRWSDPRDLVVLGIYFAALLVLLATDLDQKLLPDLITLPLIVYALAVVLLGWNPLITGKELPLVSSIAAGIGAPVVLVVTDRLFRGGLGQGDVKLAVSLGLMSGVSRLVGGLLLASIVAGVVLLVLIAMRRIGLRTAIPFGPILIGAGIVAALLP